MNKKPELGDVVDNAGGLLYSDGEPPFRQVILFGCTTVRWEQAHRASKFGWRILVQVPDLPTHVIVFRDPAGRDWVDADAPTPRVPELV